MNATIKLNPLQGGPWLNWMYVVYLRNKEGSLVSLAYANDVLTASLIANAFNVPVTVEV